MRIIKDFKERYLRQKSGNENIETKSHKYRRHLYYSMFNDYDQYHYDCSISMHREKRDNFMKNGDTYKELDAKVIKDVFGRKSRQQKKLTIINPVFM